MNNSKNIYYPNGMGVPRSSKDEGRVPIADLRKEGEGTASPGEITTPSALSMQHNLVSLIYTANHLIENYLSKAEVQGVETSHDTLDGAKETMNRIHLLMDKAYEMTRRISLALRSKRALDEQPQAASIGKAWEEVLEVLRRRYSLKALEVIEHIPEDFPAIDCKQSELFEILYYLAQNAVQALSVLEDPGGSKTNRMKKIIIRANLEYRVGDKPQAVIAVADTGPGISEDLLTNVFEPFFTTKPVHQGNGLGLALVKSLVKRNQGRLAVSSFRGCGTTMTLSFPLAPALPAGRRRGGLSRESTERGEQDAAA